MIVEDHALFAEALEIVLTVEGYDVRRVHIDDQPLSPQQMVAAILRHQPRVVLLDLDLGPFGDGARIINPLARAGANVVVVTASLDEARWGECLWHGARKTLAKTRPLNEIVAVVRRLSQGLAVIDAPEREHLLQTFHAQRRDIQQHRERLERLTPRERQVLGHLMLGHQVRDIARHSVVSEATVRTQVKAILSKLNVSSQLAAVGLARAAEWTPPRGRSADVSPA